MGKGIPPRTGDPWLTRGSSWCTGPPPTSLLTVTGVTSATAPRQPSWWVCPMSRHSAPAWDPKVARVFCTLFRGREEVDQPGGFLTSDCRVNLHRLHKQFTADTGLTLYIGCEPEMMWLKTNPDGTPSVEGMTKPYCYHIDQFSELQPVIHKVIEYSTKMGLDMIQGDHEDAPGQLELNFTFGRAEETADRLTTYRQVCRQVGREFVCFPVSCPNRSWACRPTGVTTTSHCGRTT